MMRPKGAWKPRWGLRGLLVLAIEFMALSTLWLRDIPLAVSLQLLALLVLSVDRIDRQW